MPTAIGWRTTRRLHQMEVTANIEVVFGMAKHRVNNEEPLKTSKKDHNAWYRLINGELLEDVWVHSA